MSITSCVWSPYNVALISQIECVQRSFTKKLFGLSKTSYPNRLKALSIESLELRPLKADLCMYYKILWGWVNLDASQFFTMASSTITRGHVFKLSKPICKNSRELNWFNRRAINAWNHLPESVVVASSVNVFKRSLASVDLATFCSLY